MGLAEFIVRENYEQHGNTQWIKQEFKKSVYSLLMKDRAIFESSAFYVASKGSKIFGSVKVTRWDGHIPLPIQELFGIDPKQLLPVHGSSSIWHIGRFAIAQEVKEGARLLKKLIAYAIYPICLQHNSLMVAECDSRFVRCLNLMGIQTGLLGQGIYYLGSETIPIYSKQEWLEKYLADSPYIDEVIQLYNRENLTAMQGIISPLNMPEKAILA